METTPKTDVTTDDSAQAAKDSEPVIKTENGEVTVKIEEVNGDEENEENGEGANDEDATMTEANAGNMDTENGEEASGGKGTTDDSSAETKVHPYQHLIDNFEIPKLYLTKIKNIRTRPVNKVPCIFVSTRTMLSEIVERLALERDIGVVLKYNTLSYIQRLCLILISTRRANYMIDCLKLQNSLHMLGDIFANPKILKIMHGAMRILKSLQLDHNLYFVNIFDTEAAMKKLKWSTVSLRAHIERFNVRLPQETGLMKWHLRPLPEKYKMHALTYMHYLIPTYLSLKNKLIDAKLMEDFLKECNRRCGIVYKHTNTLESIFPDMAFMKPGQVYAIHELEEWRHRIARKKKKNVNMILFRTNFQKLINKMPTKKAQIIEISGSQTVAAHADEVHKIFMEAKKVIGPINSRFAANVKLVKEQKKPAVKAATGAAKVKKAVPVKGRPRVKAGLRPKAMMMRKGRVAGPVRRQNLKPNFIARTKPMGIRRGGVIKTTDRIDNRGFRFSNRPAPPRLPRSPRVGNGFPYVPSRDTGNGGRFNSRMPQPFVNNVQRDPFANNAPRDPFVNNARRDPFECMPNQPWQSPDRSRNFESRPPIWEHPPKERDIWNTPQRENFDRWSSRPRMGFNDLDVNIGNSNNFNSNSFRDRNDFFNNDGFNNRFGNSDNRGPRDRIFGRDSMGSNFSGGFLPPSRNNDFIAYPKYNPSRYNNQGYY